MKKKKNKVRNKYFIGIMILIILTILLIIISKTISAVNSEGTFTVINSAPDIDNISDVIAAEGDLITITPTATDKNMDTITYYYGLPLNSSGEWRTAEGDGGIYLAEIIASDGIDNSSVFFYIKIAPFCGDGICNFNRTESCTSCPDDCGTCPPTETIYTGGGGGSGESYTFPEEVPKQVLIIPGDKVIVPGNQNENKGEQQVTGITQFKIRISILNEDINIEQEYLKFKLNIKTGLGPDEKSNVKVSYVIVPYENEDSTLITGAAVYDENNRLIPRETIQFYKEENLEIQGDEVNIVREVELPKGLKSGRYKILIIAEYKDSKVYDTGYFTVIAAPGLEIAQIWFGNWIYMIIAVILLIIIILFILCKRRKKKSKKKKCFFGKKKKKARKKIKR